MLNPLCSLARNPDGSLVRPTPYEINSAYSAGLALAAGAVLLLGVVLAIVHLRRSSSPLTIGCVAISGLSMALHPLWTVDTRSGDCGSMQVLFSFIVLGIVTTAVSVQLILFLLARGGRWTAECRDYDDHFLPPAHH